MKIKLMCACLPVLLALTSCANSNAPAKNSLTNTPSITGDETMAASLASPLAQYHKISAEEALQMMESTDDYILLDVRTEEEFTESHIEGALLIPDYEIESRASDELPDKSATLLVYCRSGRRSAGAAKVLVSMGYTNVYDLGGIMDWPYETVSD